MCGSKVDIQSTIAENMARNKRKKKEEPTAVKYNGLPINRYGRVWSPGGHDDDAVARSHLMPAYKKHRSAPI